MRFLANQVLQNAAAKIFPEHKKAKGGIEMMDFSMYVMKF